MSNRQLLRSLCSELGLPSEGFVSDNFCRSVHRSLVQELEKSASGPFALVSGRTRNGVDGRHHCERKKWRSYDSDGTGRACYIFGWAASNPAGLRRLVRELSHQRNSRLESAGLIRHDDAVYFVGERARDPAWASAAARSR